MSEIPPRDIRIGDAERDQALKVLGEHMSAGRIDVGEYGERSARITTAKTRGELLELFTDLPDPRPSFLVPTPMMPVSSSPAVPKWAGAVVPAVGLAVVALVFFTKLWVLLLIIPAAALLFGRFQGGGRYR
ncbi:hypothetical protein Lesp02_78370 [Lentzea sp. NBRC 105346]|uniref:DUF1707 SHOCT-like domain-containing protein n=1 Tax=Lentzea sp. NBRC 105346 TaxID=3032205 RepID=UPI0024A60212|nr:DUF1707 domain-containing protein [Lentzea sp. NBRC 105346]GLZ35650.1 hypothetical protein Lesp02_78370 [Lentzea sp. NBRC 105346]